MATFQDQLDGLEKTACEVDAEVTLIVEYISGPEPAEASIPVGGACAVGRIEGITARLGRMYERLQYLRKSLNGDHNADAELRRA